MNIEGHNTLVSQMDVVMRGRCQDSAVRRGCEEGDGNNRVGLYSPRRARKSHARWGADENVRSAGQNGGTRLRGGSPPGDPREKTV